ncbi:MAG: nucleotidyltransferase family protein [Parasporobacterium sp.]|nr:nucleotidyltransferase family protein [Parasporobacterium sp.]
MNIQITEGSFSREGLPNIEDRYLRAERRIAEGVDAVFELPFHAAVNTSDSVSTAGVALHENLKCSDGFKIYASSDDHALLQTIAKYIFMTEMGRRKEIAGMKERGWSKWKIRSFLVEEKFPGAAGLFDDDQNISAVEDLISCKCLYSTIRTEICTGISPEKSNKRMDACTFDRFILEKLASKHDGYSEKDTISALLDISGAFPRNVKAVCEGLKAGYTMTQIDSAINPHTPDIIQTRQLILKMLLDIRGIDNIIFSISTFIPYVKLLAYKNEEVLNRLRKHSSVTIIDAAGDENPAVLSGIFDECKYMLYKADLRAEKLYSEASSFFI